MRIRTAAFDFVLLFLVLGAVYFTVVYNNNIKPAVESGTALVNNGDRRYLLDVTAQETCVVQNFTADSSFTGFTIAFGCPGETCGETENYGPGYINIRMVIDGEVIYNADLTQNDALFAANLPLHFDLGGIYRVNGVCAGEIIITSYASAPLGIWMGAPDAFASGGYLLNGEEAPGYVSYSILSDKPTLSGLKYAYFAVCLLSLLCFSAAWYLLRCKEAGYHSLFLLASACFGLLFMFIMPPGTAPDENAHIGNAYMLSNRMLGKDADTIRASDASVSRLKRRPAKEDYAHIMRAFAKPADNTEIVGFDHGETIAMPHAYVVSALGITAARLLNLNTAAMLFLGRLFNLALYTAAVYFAIKKAPFAKLILFCVALFPMALQLAASYSYDACINAAAFICIAYNLFFIFGDNENSPGTEVTTGDLCVLTVSTAFLAASKGGVYLPLCLMPLAVPRARLNDSGNTAVKHAKVIILSAAALSFFVMGVPAVLSNSGDAGAASTAASTYNLLYLIQNPFDTAAIICRSIAKDTYYYAVTSVGRLLGYFDIPIPVFAVALYVSAALTAAFNPESTGQKPRVAHRVFFVSLFVLSSSLVYLSMLTAHTPFGIGIVFGVQGRYFLPVIPLLFIALTNSGYVFKHNAGKVVVMTVCGLHAFVSVEIFSFITRR